MLPGVWDGKWAGATGQMGNVLVLILPRNRTNRICREGDVFLGQTHDCAGVSPKSGERSS